MRKSKNHQNEKIRNTRKWTNEKIPNPESTTQGRIKSSGQGRCPSFVVVIVDVGFWKKLPQPYCLKNISCWADSFLRKPTADDDEQTMASIFEIPEELFSRHCVVWDVSPPRFFQRLFIRATWCSSTGGATSRRCDFHASREVRHRSLKGALHVTAFVIRISGTNFRHTVVE